MEPHPFRLLRNLGRTQEIVRVLLNHGFGDLVDRIGLREVWYRWAKILRRRPSEPLRHLRIVERVRLALESLGPTFVKFGQVMSTRPDLVPAEMLAELRLLQERVKPFESELAIVEVERELGKPVLELFRSFELEPLAAGSLGQVHRAEHFDGTKLAVKIRRPSAMRDVERDLMLMQELAALAERHLPELRVFDPVGLVNHFARTIRRELNFAREGRSMQEFARLFKSEKRFYVARVYPELTTEAVLTMEYIEGLSVVDRKAIEEAGYEPAELAVLGARLFMRQTFEFGVFHGDPHPGNIRIKPDGSICLLDYGMIGLLDDVTRQRLVDLFMAISHRHVEGAIAVVLQLGEVGTKIDGPLLEVDMRDFIENYYGVELERLQVGSLLSDFVSLLSNHRIRCPGNLMLLIRALVTLEGVGRQLDPGFNLAKELQPFVERSVAERYRPDRVVRQTYDEVKRLASAMSGLPGYLNSTLSKLSRDELSVQLEHRGLDHLITEVERSSNRLAVGMVVSALILASALLIHQSAGHWWITVPMYVLSSLLAIWLVYGIFRSGRL